MQIDDALYAELERHFSRKQIIDICRVAGQIALPQMPAAAAAS